MKEYSILGIRSLCESLFDDGKMIEFDLSGVDKHGTKLCSKTKIYVSKTGNYGIDSSILDYRGRSYLTSNIRPCLTYRELELLDIRGKGSGRGPFLMESLMTALAFLKAEYGVKCQYMFGNLTLNDKQRGNWKKSLSFYRHFAERNGIRYCFTAPDGSFDRICDKSVDIFLNDTLFADTHESGKVWYLF